ncbi:MAG: single-stranded DNA-binding protein [Anaerolineales bacterium]|nr:MAG: single-stranded DNA-binding protein [Anaerolineales bacterium]
MFHKVILVGNLGRDPEMRYTPSGTAVTNLSIASNRRFTDSSGEVREETVWFRVSVWGKQAETVNQYLRKGRQVLVEGRLVPDENGNPRIWNRQDGTPAASFEVSAVDIRFLGGREDSASIDADEAPGALGPETEDEIPF